jgi:glutamyl-tRNA reductase
MDNPLIIVDLGVPPNIHPSAALQPGLRLLDMDELISRTAANSEKRMAAVPQAFTMLQEEVDVYLAECEKKAASPAIETIVKYAESIKDQNLRWATERLGHLSSQDLKIVSDLAQRMVRGFTQSPIRELKDERTPPQARDLVSNLFRMEQGGDSNR